MENFENLVAILWGKEAKIEIFERWSQGFVFSKFEPTALEQFEGGPCAVLAPVQAFILKNLHENYGKFEDFRKSVQTSDQQKNLLSEAIFQIISRSRSDFPAENRIFKIITLENSPEIENFENFHRNLRVNVAENGENLRKFLSENIEIYQTKYGVLLFLYSVILTRTLEKIACDNELSHDESLIESIYGHATQSLINLMATGRATNYLWDDVQILGGMSLKGVEKKNEIGFLSQMEHLRYLTVGTNYKNPEYPIWILASDTHLTVIFSDEQRLVAAESRAERARRVFKKHDKNGNNFVESAALRTIFDELEIDEPSRKRGSARLDPENLGVVLLAEFMETFFPLEEGEGEKTVDVFRLVHWNGLGRSNTKNEVKYNVAHAILLESDLRAQHSEHDAMLNVLQTKWPTIEITWEAGIAPSIN